MAWAVYALAFAVASVALGIQTVERVRVGLDDDLTAVEGSLQGPRNLRKNVNDRWTFASVRGIGATFTTGPSGTDILVENRNLVTGYFSGDALVKVVTSDGQTVRSLDVGARGATSSGLWLATMSAGAVGLALAARRRRGLWGGWLAITGPTPGIEDFVTPVLACMPVLGLMALSLGAPWQAALGTLGLAFAYVVWTLGPLVGLPGRRTPHRH